MSDRPFPLIAFTGGFELKVKMESLKNHRTRRLTFAIQNLMSKLIFLLIARSGINATGQ